MAAGVFSLYNSAKLKFLTGALLDLDTLAIRAKLFKGQAAASVSAANALSLFSQIGTSNAAANCSVKTLADVSVEKLNGSATMKFKSGNLVFTAEGGNIGSCQYIVFYASVSAGGGPVLGWNKLSTAAFDVTQDNTLTVNAPTNGWFVSY